MVRMQKPKGDKQEEGYDNQPEEEMKENWQEEKVEQWWPDKEEISPFLINDREPEKILISLKGETN